MMALVLRLPRCERIWGGTELKWLRGRIAFALIRAFDGEFALCLAAANELN
jgi:hypothetical protein